MYKVKISVIIPCYNAEKHIMQAIQSILNQTYKNFELIIVNDGSTDDTESVVKQFNDPRIKFQILKRNKGNYHARNVGLKLAQGKYIAFLDADDIAKDYRLETQFDFLEKHKNVGCIGGLSEVIDQDGQLIGKIDRPLNYKEIKVCFLKDNYLTQSTMMIRAGLIKKHLLSFNEKYLYSGDYDFVARILHLFPVINLDQVLVQYRVHRNQISSSKNSEQRAYARQIRGNQLDIFQIKYTKEELQLHLNLMEGNTLSAEKTQTAINWLNRLLEANEIQKIFSKKTLFTFFSQILNWAISNEENQG